MNGQISSGRGIWRGYNARFNSINRVMSGILSWDKLKNCGADIRDGALALEKLRYTQ